MMFKYILLLCLIEVAICIPKFQQHRYPFEKIRNGGQYSNQRTKSSLRGTPADYVQQISTIASQFMKCRNVTGLAIGIVAGDSIYPITLGTKDGISPVDAKTNFGIGSTSKAFTSFLAGLYVDKQQLDWFTPVQNYLPAFQMYTEFASQRATIRDLLTHKTGLPDHGYDIGYIFGTQLTREELVYNMEYLQTSAELRDIWQYSNIGVTAAGFLVGEIGGSTWEDLVNSEVMEPIGMTRTFPDVKDAIVAGNIADPYVSIPYADTTTNKRVQSTPQIDAAFEPVNPAGGIYSNINDMTKWVQVHLNGGKLPNGKQLISKATLQQIHDPQVSMYPSGGFGEFYAANIGQNITISDQTYGMCWVVETYRGLQHIWHDGEVFGYNAQVSLFPGSNLGYVGLTNADGVNADLILLAYLTHDLFTYGKSWVDESVFCGSTEARKDTYQEFVDKIVYTRAKRKSAQQRDASAYANVYRHPFFQYFNITQSSSSSSGLFGSYGAVSGPLVSMGDNFFVMEGVDPKLPSGMLNLQFPLQFLVNTQDEIDSLAVPFDDQVPWVVFTNNKWIPRGQGYAT